jgi:two-component sensor histidine kinase
MRGPILAMGGTAGLVSDLEARKEGEERLRSTLKEKEALVSELYHRTKNSMQLINAMLELKRREIGDPRVDAAFNDIENKILAMALVQEKLYQSDRLSSIDLGSYVTDLIDRLRMELPPGPSLIDFQAEGESIEVSVDIAIPCGLILSELIGNSVAHAFRDRPRGSIKVALSRGLEGGICLEEWDDGVGLPSGYDPRVSGRLGLRTVIGIGEEQLKGSVHFGSRKGGFSCTLNFDKDYYPKRL